MESLEELFNLGDELAYLHSLEELAEGEEKLRVALEVPEEGEGELGVMLKDQREGEVLIGAEQLVLVFCLFTGSSFSQPLPVKFVALLPSRTYRVDLLQTLQIQVQSAQLGSELLRMIWLLSHIWFLVKVVSPPLARRGGRGLLFSLSQVKWVRVLPVSRWVLIFRLKLQHLHLRPLLLAQILFLIFLLL